jgi:hypothetical protein
MVELTELAVRSFTSAAEKSGSIGPFVSAKSQEHGVRVNPSELMSLRRHLYRHYVVIVYQSAELFLHEFRREHVGLHGREWKGDADDTDPLTVTLKNITASEAQAVGEDLITRFQYYRVVRNWAVHAKESDIEKPKARYDEISQYANENKERFGPVAAPNPPDKLTFDDFILFSRLTKCIAQRLCLAAFPPENHWITSFDVKRFKRLIRNQPRMRNAIAGRLRTEFGLDAETANWIAEEIAEKARKA